MFKPFFLQGHSGRLFAIFYPPSTDLCRGVIVHVPAFAEEMNKSRHMVAKQARAFAELGYGTLVFDYYGTGDSEGEFSEASWEIWRNDLLQVVAWCRENVSQEVVLWGLRFGSLLATSVVSLVAPPIKQLLLWNPVSSGEQYMTQFLRLRLASSMMSGAEKETVQDLKDLLEKGHEVEVAGYSMSDELYQEISEQALMSCNLDGLKNVGWFEVNTKIKALSPVGQKVIDNWQSESLKTNDYQVAGSQFWTNQEIVFANQLVEKTTEYMAASDEVTIGEACLECD